MSTSDLTFRGVTASVYGPLASWTGPDGRLYLATLVWREGGRQADGSIAPAGWAAVTPGVIDPRTVFPDLAPPADPPVVADLPEKVGTWVDETRQMWLCSCVTDFSYGNTMFARADSCPRCHTTRPPR